MESLEAYATCERQLSSHKESDPNVSWLAKGIKQNAPMSSRNLSVCDDVKSECKLITSKECVRNKAPTANTHHLNAAMRYRGSSSNSK
jgi:hypothetical protein